MSKVTKDTRIGELLMIDENVAPILMNIGMHGVDADGLVDDINNYLESQAS